MLFDDLCVHFRRRFVVWMVVALVVVVVVVGDRGVCLVQGALDVTAHINDLAAFVKTTGTTGMMGLYGLLALFADRKSHRLERKMRGAAAFV